MAGIAVEMVVVTKEMAEDKAFKNKNVTQSFPLLEIAEENNMVLFDVLAIAKYFARRVPEKKLTGSSALESALVEEWLQRAVTQLKPDLNQVSSAIFGASIFKDEYESSFSKVKQQLMGMNKHLSDREWLVSDQMTVADVVLAGLLVPAFQCMMDKGFTSALGKVFPWFTKVTSNAFFKAGFGEIRANKLEPKNLIVRDLPKAAKKEEKKPVEEKAKGEKKPVEGAAEGKPAKQKKLSKKDRIAAQAQTATAATSGGEGFGDMPLNKSQCNPEDRFKIKYTDVKDINEKIVDQEIRVRGRLHKRRAAGKNSFLVIRESYETVQAIVSKADTSAGMVKFADNIPPESIIEIVAKVVNPGVEIGGASIQMELHIKELWTVNRSVPILPFQLADASRRCENQETEGDEKEGEKFVVVSQDTRLDNRVIDLRVPANQAIMRLQSGVCRLFREFLLEQDFVEIHSPKLLGGSSEGGSEVFTLEYFGKPACMAQSPQLYKQMALCGDLERVFEIGPVFRAENSNTNRHLCEFTGLDMEMTFKNHYFEVLDVLGSMLISMFKGL